MLRIKRRERVDARLVELENRLHETKQTVESVRKMIEQLDSLVRQLHTDSWNANNMRSESLQQLMRQLHADNWDADERRALSLADVVLLSLTPRIDSMKQELLALVGEKAVEVFRERSKED